MTYTVSGGTLNHTHSLTFEQYVWQCHHGTATAKVYPVIW